jgi:hypothetical protein
MNAHHCPTCGRFMKQDAGNRAIYANGRAYPAEGWLCKHCHIRSMAVETTTAGRLLIHFDLPPNKPQVRWETF